MDDAETSIHELPANWWQNAELLLREHTEHGTFEAIEKAHPGVSPRTMQQWWRRLGLPKLAPGPKRAVVNALDELPPTDPERIKADQIDAELRHFRRENRQLREAQANREAIIEQIVEAARVPVHAPMYKVRKPAGKQPVRSAVLPVYDCQFGQLVKPEDTPLGAGEFNTAIFDRRLQRWLDAVTGSMRDYATSHRIEETVLLFGGDLVEGEDIFAGQAWQLEHDPARQTVLFVRRWQKAVSTLIGFLKEEIGVQRIRVLAIPGNHGKVGGKRKGATPSTMSWDWLAAEWLKDGLRGEPIDQWGIEPGGAVMFESAKHLFLAIHGDEIRGWGGLPFYGMTRYDGRAMRYTGEIFDYLLMGHHHQPASIPNGSGGEFIVSGDWVGANNLSRYLASASRPQQRLLFVGAKYGVTENVPLYLDELKPAKRRIYTPEGVAA